MTSHAPHGGDDMVHDRELDEMVGLSAPESGAQAGASTQAPRHVLKDLRYDEEPCKWPASRIIVSNSAKIPLPLDLETRRFSPFRSVATPACVNLATIKMPLTAKEILLVSFIQLTTALKLKSCQFFPQHINNHDLQDRFYQNKIKAATQAVVIVSVYNQLLPNMTFNSAPNHG